MIFRIKKCFVKYRAKLRMTLVCFSSLAQKKEEKKCDNISEYRQVDTYIPGATSKLDAIF